VGLVHRGDGPRGEPVPEVDGAVAEHAMV
jgi:hypothetical protein